MGVRAVVVPELTVAQAYEQLSDADRRRDYDFELQSEAHGRRPRPPGFHGGMYTVRAAAAHGSAYAEMCTAVAPAAAIALAVRVLAAYAPRQVVLPQLARC